MQARLGGLAASNATLTVSLLLASAMLFAQENAEVRFDLVNCGSSGIEEQLRLGALVFSFTLVMYFVRRALLKHEPSFEWLILRAVSTQDREVRPSGFDRATG